MTDDLGQLIEDEFTIKETWINSSIESENQIGGKRIVQYMVQTDKYGKCIIFCEDIDHAERMRSASQ